MDYFELFEVPKKFTINKFLLSKNFYKLQLKCHPDLFINSSESQKKIILEKSIQINKGYRILKNFLNRAIYLLSLYGLEIDEKIILADKNMFLKKYFSLYEEFENLQKNQFDKVKLNNFLKKIEEKIKKHEKQIEVVFEKKNFDVIVSMIQKLLFLKKIKINLKKQQNR